MVEDIRTSLNYNYKITAQKFRDTNINAERFGTAQNLYDTADRNIKTLEDLITIVRELKKERKYDELSEYSDAPSIKLWYSKETILPFDLKSGNLRI